MSAFARPPQAAVPGSRAAASARSQPAVAPAPALVVRPPSPSVGVAVRAQHQAPGGGSSGSRKSGGAGQARGRTTERRRKVRSAGTCELCKKQHRHTHHLPIQGVVCPLRVSDWAPVNMDVCGSCWKWANRHFGGQHKRCATKPSKACERHLLDADEAGVRLVAQNDAADGEEVAQTSGGVAIPLPLRPAAPGAMAANTALAAGTGAPRAHAPPAGQRARGSGAAAAMPASPTRPTVDTRAHASGGGARGSGGRGGTGAGGAAAAAVPPSTPTRRVTANATPTGLFGSRYAPTPSVAMSALDGDEGASRYSEGKDMLLDLMRDLRRFSNGGAASTVGPVRGDASFAGASELFGPGMGFGGSVSRAASEAGSDWYMGVASVRGGGADGASRRGSMSTLAPPWPGRPSRPRRGSGDVSMTSRAASRAESRRRSVSSGRASVRAPITRQPSGRGGGGGGGGGNLRSATPQSWLTLSDLAQFHFHVGAEAGSATPMAAGVGGASGVGGTGPRDPRAPTPARSLMSIAADSWAKRSSHSRSRSASPSLSRVSRMSHPSFGSMALDSLLNGHASDRVTSGASEAGMSLAQSISGLSVSGAARGQRGTHRRRMSDTRPPSVAQSVQSTRTDLMNLSTFSFPAPRSVMDPAHPSDLSGAMGSTVYDGMSVGMNTDAWADESVAMSISAMSFSVPTGWSGGGGGSGGGSGAQPTASHGAAPGSSGLTGTSSTFGTPGFGVTPPFRGTDGSGDLGASEGMDTGELLAMATGSGSARGATSMPPPPAPPVSGGPPAPPWLPPDAHSSRPDLRSQPQQDFRDGPSHASQPTVVLPRGLVSQRRPPTHSRRVVGRTQPGSRPAPAGARMPQQQPNARVDDDDGDGDGDDGGGGSHQVEEVAGERLGMALALTGPLFAAQQRLQAARARETRRRLRQHRAAAARSHVTAAAQPRRVAASKVTREGRFLDGTVPQLDRVGFFSGLSRMVAEVEGGDGDDGASTDASDGTADDDGGESVGMDVTDVSGLEAEEGTSFSNPPVDPLSVTTKGMSLSSLLRAASMLSDGGDELQHDGDTDADALPTSDSVFDDDDDSVVDS